MADQCGDVLPGGGNVPGLSDDDDVPRHSGVLMDIHERHDVRSVWWAEHEARRFDGDHQLRDDSHLVCKATTIVG